MDEIEEISGEPQYTPLTDAEVRDLSLAIRAGTAMGSWQVPKDLLLSVFIPLLFLDPVDVKTMQRDGIVHAYALLADSFPRSINGYPCFHRIRMINEADVARLRTAMDALAAFMGDERG